MRRLGISRHARLAAIGWRVMAITWRQLTEEPKNVLARLKHALKYRGQLYGPATQ
jgi:very-short-patch-repair endonuclease